MKTTRRYAAAALLLLLPLPLPTAAAQQLRDIRIGTPFRFHPAAGGGERWVVGTLVGVNAHEVRLQLRDSGETITVPLDEMQQGEFSREARTAAGRGALIGFLLGAVVGSAAGGCDCNQPGLARGFSGLLLGGLGSGIGALVGTGFRMEDWTPFQGPLAPPAARSPVRPRLFQIRVAF